MDWVSRIMLWAHIVSVVTWIGGISYILFVLLPAMPNVALRDRARYVPVLLRRFLWVVWVSVVAIFVTGLYRIFFVWNAAEAAFWGTPQGRTLVEKLGLVGAILVVVLLVTFRVVPGAIAHVATHADDPADAYKCPQCLKVIGGMKRHLQVGFAIGLVIILYGVMLRG